jgi:hypothetical protein
MGRSENVIDSWRSAYANKRGKQDRDKAMLGLSRSMRDELNHADAETQGFSPHPS